MASIVVKRVKGYPYCYFREQRRIGGKVRPKDTILFCCDPRTMRKSIFQIHIGLVHPEQKYRPLIIKHCFRNRRIHLIKKWKMASFGAIM